MLSCQVLSTNIIDYSKILPETIHIMFEVSTLLVEMPKSLRRWTQAENTPVLIRKMSYCYILIFLEKPTFSIPAT